MSDENQVNAEQTQDEAVDYKALYEKTQADLQAVARKKDELLSEKKVEAEKRRQAEMEAEQQKLEKSKKDGDYESVLKSYEAEKKAWQEKYENLNNSLTKKEIRQKAVQMANDLKPLDTDAMETLADYIEKRIKYQDGNMMYLDKDGHPSVMGADEIKQEFVNSNKFKPLLKGSEATGGGAPGATSSAKATSLKEINIDEFNNLDPLRKLEFSKLVASGQAKLI